MNRLGDPLIGRTERRSTVGLGYLGVTTAIVLAQAVLSAFVFTGSRAVSVAIVYDGIALLASLLVAVSLFAAVLYAAVNGGPALAAAIALVPSIAGSLARAHLSVTIDGALAVSAAAAAVWLAAWITYDRHSETERIEWAVGLGAGLTVLSAGTLRDVSFTVGPYARIGEWVAAGFFTLGILVLVGWVLSVAIAEE